MTVKRKLYDYRGLRLNNITDPRYKHLLLLLGWVGYFILYFVTENFIPWESCHPIHCALDDVIPFNEFFAIPYCFWYALVFGSLAFYLFFDPEKFSELQLFIIVTQVVAMAVYIIYPSRQELRPEVFVRDNFFTRLMAFIYDFDTSTGVCPSLHVAYSVGIASVWCKDELAPRWWKVFVVFAAVIISAATCFVKQHSAVDVVAAIPVCVLAELIVYWKKRYKPRLDAKRAIKE